MSLAIVGAGLITPFGETPTEHAFFLRASVPAPPPSPFRLREDDSALHTHYCRWIGAAAAVDQRLLRMVNQAVRDALRPCGALGDPGGVHLLLCASNERPGLTEETLSKVLAGLASRGTVHRYSGDAGVFAALREAPSLLRSRGARVVVAAAVDSFVCIDALDEHVLHSPSEWDLDPPAPSEGAAAIALVEPHEARRGAVPILGHVDGAAVAVGQSNDDNQELVDGSAMTTVLRQLPAPAPVGSAFGPFKVNLLRQAEWHLASARNAERFARECRFSCFESHVGRLGAASGLANLVYGLAVHRHRAAETVAASDAPFFAWAISPDGTRGAAVLGAREPRA
jgi:hypothetical protein